MVIGSCVSIKVKRTEECIKEYDKIMKNVLVLKRILRVR